MDHVIEKNSEICTLRFSQGEDFFETLKDALNDLDFASGIVVTGIGMLTDFELGYFDGEVYHNDFFSKPHELTTMQGTIAIKEGHGELLPHIHATLAGADHKVIGGHLHRAKVGVLCELVLLKFNKKLMMRKQDPDSDLWVLSL